MSRRQYNTTIREINEINMTPLMDLTFILLITFIITFPLIEQGIPVNLPVGKAEELDEGKTRSISLNLEGSVFLDDEPVTMEELTERMNSLGRASPDIAVMVRADEKLQYAKVVEIMKILHGAKISKMALVTQPETN
ncbi:MAG: biopolymer transporter ExbD [Verrucomicrobiota bacterium]